MKKIALISLAAIAALVSCQKEEFVNESQAGNSPVFTASIATDGTKTTLSDDSPAKILWESSDKITITDGTHTAVYKLSAGEGTKSGTFIKDSGDDLDNPGTYTATYGAAPSAYQVYSSAGSVPLYMTASASSTNDLVFTAQCGVLRVTLTDASHDIMRVEVSDASGNTYRVTSSSAVGIASAKKFYIALPAGTYTTLNIYDDNWQMVSKTGISLVVTAGHVKPAANTSTLTFTDCTTKGFKSINSVVRAIVQLWADGPFWAENNIGADTPEAYGQYFAWGYTTAYSWTGSAWSPSIIFDYTGFSDYTTHPYADMATAAWGTGWSVPTADQYDILVNYDHSAGSSKSQGKCSVTKVTEGVAGIRITGTTEGYTSNSIFLPAAGLGNGSNFNHSGTYGIYWSSVQFNSYAAYAMDFEPGADYLSVSYGDKYGGYSVRPVYAPAEPVLLSGEFSVSGTKKVKFTKGNLYWNGSDWKIESAQTDYPTGSTWNTSHVGHLFWTKDAANSYAASYSDGTCAKTDKFFVDGSDADHMLTIDGQSGLYALSKGEWTYLINSRTSGLYKCDVTVTNAGTEYAKCIILAPDDYTGTPLSEITDWSLSNINTLGLVCLPAAGIRVEEKLQDAGKSFYWSASPSETQAFGDNPVWNFAYCVYYVKNLSTSAKHNRGNGYSVRLVSTVSPE